MNHLDLFSGIGGFSLGLKKVFNIKNTYFSDIDKYAIDVFKYNFKKSKYVGSVTDVQSKELPKIDIITFGSPCQDFSLAGKRRGLEGQRSSLISEAIRLICECRPSFFIWENVKGTFSSNNGEDFWAILKEFTNIGGYRLEWQLLNTKWFLPQNRERIYLVGYTPNRSRGQVFPIGDYSKKDNVLQVKHPTTATLIARYTALGSGSYIVERQVDAQEVIVKANTKKGFEIAKPGDSINIAQPNSKTRRGRVGKQQAQTLETSCNQAVIGYSRDKKGKVTNYHEKDEANTLHSSSGGGGNTDQYITNRQNIRRLTPLECERLQGFPDNWTLAEDNSDTQRYKMCGNAVTVDVVREVAKRIKKTLY